MPGSFTPEDYIDFYDNPFEDLENIQTAWKDRETAVPWSTNNLDEVDVTNIKWHEYKPPVALRRTPNVTSQILLDILYSSIENVRARATEQHQKQLDEEEQRKQEDDSKKLDKGKGKEPYLPIIIPEDKPAHQDRPQADNDDDEATPRHSFVSQTPSASTLVSASAKPEKRRMFAIRKFFQRSHEKGESSATGSAIESLRKIYDRNSSHGSVTDLVSGLKTELIDELVECVSCLDDFPSKKMIKVPCHSYCQDCFIRLISAAVQNEQQWPPKCCLNAIPVKTILRVIPADLRKTFQDRSQEWDIPVSNRVYCGQQGCSLWVKPVNISARAREGVCADKHTTCTVCRGPGHKGKECEQDPDMELTNTLAEEEGWKRCFNCNALVEHREACQHMTCRCGTQFCYVCGERWRTCGCTMQQLADLKTAAETRREERRVREQSDVEELRQMLLQIEEFEREEALKAEMLRQEQERLEEERKQRELEERVRQESLRRRDIELKYQELRTILDQLHELQLVLFEVDQEEMTEELAAETKKVKDELVKKQEAERSDLDTLMITKLKEKEYALNKEFQIRAAEENDIEEAYHERLTEYWKDKNEDSDAEIDAAMLVLRKRMDQSHHAWQKWKKEAIRRFESKLTDDLTYKEELRYSAKSRLDDQCEEKERELLKRREAEKKWLEMVVVEREKLLSEWEVQEVEGDADSLFTPESDNGGEERAPTSA